MREKDAVQDGAAVRRPVLHAERPPLSGLPSSATLLALQRAAGNAAVTAMLAQREGADGGDMAPDSPTPEATPIGPIDERVTLQEQPQIPVPGQGEMGDYPLPGKDVPTAQADADTPHPSADIAVQYPWTYQGTVIYRNLNLAQIRSLHLDLGVHEPQLSLSISPNSGMALQYGATLINWHWMEPWNRELELGLSGLVSHTLLPRVSSSGSLQLQAEQHVVPWFSITFSATGTYTPAQRGNPGKFEVAPGVGAVFHFN